MEELYTTLLNTEELTTSCERLAALWNPLLNEEPLLTKLSARIESDRQAVVQAASRQASSDFTEPLKKIDEQRDAAFQTLRDFSANWTTNPIATPDQQASAARLQEIIACHGTTLYRLGYTRQSGKLSDLFAELDRPESTADLAALSLTALYEALKQAQSEFESLMSDKAAVESGEEIPTLAANLSPMRRRLHLMLENLAEWQELGGPPELDEAIAAMDEVIIGIMAPARARRTRASNSAG